MASGPVYTVQEVRDGPVGETLHWIQKGSDFATRIWAKESELELEPALAPAGERRKVGKLSRNVKVVRVRKASPLRATSRKSKPKG
jgi:hypothetical protein